MQAPPRWRVLLVIFAVSVVTNYVWELAQSPLFAAASHRGPIWLHCLIASFGDGLMVLMLFAIVSLAARRNDWFIHPTLSDYVVLAGAGAALAAFVEVAAVHLLRRWTYTDNMPVIPRLQIGLVPVLQMLVLPPLIFRITGALTVSARTAKVQRR
jgi:hypothetical protein